MESQPQNPEFRINPENFHPCIFVKFFFHSLQPGKYFKIYGRLLIFFQNRKFSHKKFRITI